MMGNEKEMIIDNVIGKQVIKISAKPFKSKLKKNTIKGIIEHPKRPNKFAYTFDEDDSYVSIEQCKII